MRLFVFHITVMPLKKAWIHLFYPQLWINSTTDWIIFIDKATSLEERKCWMQTSCTLLKTWPRVVTRPWWRGWVNTHTIPSGFWKHFLYLLFHWGCPRGVMVKALDCRIIESEFKLQSCYYVHFRKNTLGKSMNPLILSAMG